MRYHTNERYLRISTYLIPITRISFKDQPKFDYSIAHFFMCSSFSTLAISLKCFFCSEDASPHIFAVMMLTFWCRISTDGGISFESTTCFRKRIKAFRGRGMCSGCCCVFASVDKDGSEVCGMNRPSEREKSSCDPQYSGPYSFSSAS